jgi:2Fe-2S ferredoxin
MAMVTYVEFGGARHDVAVPEGESVMEGAVTSMIEGIAAECGGGLACATCHCYVDEAWIARVAPPSQTELEMLDAVVAERKAGSRLSCQIVVDASLDGLVVHLPDAQY